MPGLAKTLTIKTLADVLGAFRRVQFTPDLVPSDLVGTRIYRPDRGPFDTELGPAFCNFLLADEINRSPAKVQSALPEVMQERQVTIGPESHPVPDLGLREGVRAPRSGSRSPARASPAGRPDPDRFDFAVALTAATRHPASVGLPQVGRYIAFGASPRGSINSSTRPEPWPSSAAAVNVLPVDVLGLASDVLRHRIVVSFTTLAEEVTADMILGQLIASVPVPHLATDELTA